MKSILSIFFSFLISISFCQEYGDREFYLIDSLDLSIVGKTDRTLLDTTLELYHKEQDQLIQFELITNIIEQSWDDNIWPRYNQYLYEEIKELAPTLDKSDSLYKRYSKIHIGTINNYAYYLFATGNLNLAKEKYAEGLALAKLANDSSSMAGILHNTASLNESLGLIELALEGYQSSLEIKKKTKDTLGLATSLHNIAGIYFQQEDLNNALKYNLESMELHEKIGNKLGIASCLNDRSSVLQTQGKLDEALENLKQASRLQKDINYLMGLGYSLNNIGTIFQKKNELDSAYKYFSASYNVRVKISEVDGMIQSLIAKSAIKYLQGELDSALYFALKAEVLAKKSHLLTTSIRVHEQLYKIYKNQGKWESSLNEYEQYIITRDSSKNESTQKAAIRQQTQYEFEKEQLVKEQQLKEESRKLKEETDRRNNLQYSIIFLGILLIFGVVLSLGFVKVSPTVAEGLIFFAFLILFEFLLVLGDPFVESITGGEPIYKLLANAILAGAIFPAHAFFERLLKKKLVK